MMNIDFNRCTLNRNIELFHMQNVCSYATLNQINNDRFSNRFYSFPMNNIFDQFNYLRFMNNLTSFENFVDKSIDICIGTIESME